METWNEMTMDNSRIIYMGTPDFAVGPLRALLDAGANVVAVVTAPDREAGRGRQLMPSAVKQFAQERGLPVLQPEKLRDPDFLDRLRELNPALVVVVAFRMLPEVVWSMPPLGTINLHASLLPQYRGAAPINWAVINGETRTGVTTFFIRQQIDTGDVIYQETVEIGPDTTAGELHDLLCQIGSALMVRTVTDVLAGRSPKQPQALLDDAELHLAPKIFREDCRIDWNRPARTICDRIRGLSPYPAAFTSLMADNPEVPHLMIKIFRAFPVEGQGTPGTLSTDGRTYLRIACADSLVQLEEVQQAGKRRMSVADLIRGTDLSAYTRADSTIQ
jgi:methionyl-tRNA formyltransferase